jgi:Ner family transcriptional regulator
MTQLNTPQKTADWSAERIGAELHAVGWSIYSLAKHHSISRSTLRLALYSPAPRSEARIAEALNKHPSEIWPSRYGADGNPNRKMGRPSRAPAFVPRVIPNLKGDHNTGIKGHKVQGRRAA